MRERYSEERGRTERKRRQQWRMRKEDDRLREKVNSKIEGGHVQQETEREGGHEIKQKGRETGTISL